MHCNWRRLLSFSFTFHFYSSASSSSPILVVVVAAIKMQSPLLLLLQCGMPRRYLPRLHQQHQSAQDFFADIFIAYYFPFAMPRPPPPALAPKRPRAAANKYRVIMHPLSQHQQHHHYRHYRALITIIIIMKFIISFRVFFSFCVFLFLGFPLLLWFSSPRRLIEKWNWFSQLLLIASENWKLFENCWMLFLCNFIFIFSFALFIFFCFFAYLFLSRCFSRFSRELIIEIISYFHLSFFLYDCSFFVLFFFQFLLSISYLSVLSFPLNCWACSSELTL